MISTLRPLGSVDAPGRPGNTGAKPLVVHINGLVLLQLAVFVGGTLGLLLLQDEFVQLPIESIGLLCAVYVATTLAVLYRMSGAGIWSPSSAYVTVFCLFHFGLVIVYGLGFLNPELFGTARYWFVSDLTGKAGAVSLLGLSGCSIGIGVAHISRRSRAAPMADRHSPNIIRSQSLARSMSVVGACSVIGGVGLWFVMLVASGGPMALFVSYQQYLDLVQGSPNWLAWVFVGHGMCLVIASSDFGNRALSLSAYVAFAILLIVALPIGIRGETLFVLFGVIVVAVRKGRRISKTTTLVGVLAILTLISVVKELREVGASGVLELSRANISDGIAEMGYSIRPVTEVIRWNEQGDSAINGASYWAPIDRWFCVLLPAEPCIPADQDERLMNTLVTERVGTIGFSVVAEAFRNFGRLGVPIVMFLIGLFLGTLDRVRPSPLTNAIIGIVLIELCSNVRNAFIATPTQLAAGFLLVGACIALARLFPISNVPKISQSDRQRHTN